MYANFANITLDLSVMCSLPKSFKKSNWRLSYNIVLVYVCETISCHGIDFNQQWKRGIVDPWRPDTNPEKSVMSE